MVQAMEHIFDGEARERLGKPSHHAVDCDHARTLQERKWLSWCYGGIWALKSCRSTSVQTCPRPVDHLCVAILAGPIHFDNNA